MAKKRLSRVPGFKIIEDVSLKAYMVYIKSIECGKGGILLKRDLVFTWSVYFMLYSWCALIGLLHMPRRSKVGPTLCFKLWSPSYKNKIVFPNSLNCAFCLLSIPTLFSTQKQILPPIRIRAAQLCEHHRGEGGLWYVWCLTHIWLANKSIWQ